ncbi:MAG: metallophosphoesterase [Tannerellaceae bacterium]|nr:metallophosphoesterase [Parabacteroides sp.]MCD7915453.1 metallophosphoesterase [Tannerellaceae bacterium]
MNRRIFLKRSCTGALLATFPQFLTSYHMQKKVRFGIVTDLHYAGREKGGTRYYQQSIDKLQTAIELFNQSDLDFIIELGDFKDQDIEPDRTTTLAYLEQIESVFQYFNGPAYHVLGNHDMDSISKEDFFQHTSYPRQTNGKGYYSFLTGGIKCIVLDANFRKDGSDYDKGNFDWTDAFIPKQEKDWLRKELTGHDYSVIILLISY